MTSLLSKIQWKILCILITGILARVVHGSHPWRLLRACAFLQTVVDQRCQRVLHIWLNHVVVQRVVNVQFFSTVDSGQWENRQFRGLVWNDRLELVVVHLAGVEFKAAGEDGIGDLWSVSELRWKTADFASDGQDLLGKQSRKNCIFQRNFKSQRLGNTWKSGP